MRRSSAIQEVRTCILVILGLNDELFAQSGCNLMVGHTIEKLYCAISYKI